MAEIYSKITIGMTNRSVTPSIDMVQGDNGRGLDIFITDDIITSENGFADSTFVATLYAEKPSGQMVSLVADEVINFSNTDSYEVKFKGSDNFSNVIAEVGVTICQVVLRSNDKYVTSFEIRINVIENRSKSRKATSSQEFYDMQQMMSSFERKEAELDEYIDQFKQQAMLTVQVFYGTSEPGNIEGARDGDIYIQYK